MRKPEKQPIGTLLDKKSRELHDVACNEVIEQTVIFSTDFHRAKRPSLALTLFANFGSGSGMQCCTVNPNASKVPVKMMDPGTRSSVSLH
jgi:hypothetical protein